MGERHKIAFAIGDAGGISPELSARVLADESVNRDDMIVASSTASHLHPLES